MCNCGVVWSVCEGRAFGKTRYRASGNEEYGVFSAREYGLEVLGMDLVRWLRVGYMLVQRTMMLD